MKNLTNNNHNINSLIEQRWSTRAFSNMPVEKAKLQSILEATRWAPSAFNEQPWRFILGQKGDNTYNSLLSTLSDWNIIWASNAPVLILNIAKKTFTHNGIENITSDYDLGQAVGFMILEVVNQGLFAHQMSGFDPAKAAELFNIPDDFRAISVTAVGYYGDEQNIPEDMAAMETKPRLRKDFNEIIFSDKFGGENHL
jgi:nitroreductase